MSAPEVFVPGAEVEMTPSALTKVKSLVEEEGNPDLKLRVYITGGGCSGFQYGFAFDELAAEDDALIDQEGVSLLVDAMSYPYLIGAKVDYREDLQGAKFVVENPNAASTCGCGASFSI